MKVINTPKEVDIAITDRCNLRCKYCYHFTSAGNVGEDLPKEEWFQFFEELKECAVMKITLGGGEPFMREDLRGIISSIVKNRMRFSILSNGTLIKEDMAAFLASTGRCDHVQVSIDGSTPTTHDSMRGEGCFKKAIKGLEILRKYKIKTTVRVTIHKGNLYDLEGIAHFLLEEIGLQGFSTNVASYMGLCRKNIDQVDLSVEERSIAMEKLLMLNEKYNNRISAAAGPLAEAKGWLAMKEAHSKGKEALPGRGYLVGCGCTMQKIAVRADGVMVPCNMLSHIELGRINKDSLREIWRTHPELKDIRERRFIPLSDFKFCEGCDYLNYCTGNCPALAYTLCGKVNHPSPNACLKRFLEAGGRIPEEALLEERGG